MTWLTKLSLKHSILMLIIIFVITTFFGIVIIQKIDVETDVSKSLPRDLDVVKNDHNREKLFKSEEMIVVGVENTNGKVFEQDILRYIERKTDEIKESKMHKTYNSIITGKKESISIDIDFVEDDILSIVDADFVTTENNAIITGNYTERAKNLAGIISEGNENQQRLPESDSQIQKIIPHLRKGLIENKDYFGNILSKDEKATAIILPIRNVTDRKKEILSKELRYMVDTQLLKDRFMGNDSYFKHNIYGKDVDSTLVDDDFINDTVESNKKAVRNFFINELDFIEDIYPKFYENLDKDDLNSNYIDEIMRIIEKDDIYRLENSGITYKKVIDDSYDFMLANMDKFSKDNLEGKIQDIKRIYNPLSLYEELDVVVNKGVPENVKTYIAGYPIAQALVGKFIESDIIIFMIASALVIIVILFLSFRTLRGVLLPLSTVLITTVWVLGFMLFIGQKLSSTTVALPVILIAIGSAYCIHYLTRYYEDINKHENKRDSILESTKHINIPIIMAGITTVGGFASLISASVRDVRYLGVMASIGVLVTLILTFSYLPAMLNLISKPKRVLHLSENHTEEKKSILGRILHAVGCFVDAHYKLIFVSVSVVTLFFIFGISMIRPESGIHSMFHLDNDLVISDTFINKNLSGTGQIPVIISMRDEINLSSEGIQSEIKQKAGNFIAEYEGFITSNDLKDEYEMMNEYIIGGLSNDLKNIQSNGRSILNRINIIENIMDEDFEIELKSTNVNNGEAKNSSTSESSSEDDFDIDSLSDDDSNSEDGFDIDSLSDDDSNSEEGFDIDSLSDDDSNSEDGFDIDSLSDDDSNSEDDFDIDSLSDDDSIGYGYDGFDSDTETLTELEFYIRNLSRGSLNGIDDILSRMGVGTDDSQMELGKEFILKLRLKRGSDQSMILMGKLKELSDLFVVDFSQPSVLKQLDDLEQYLIDLEEPKPYTDDTKPVGVAVGLQDLIKTLYKVFYHDNKENFEKIPDVSEDGFEDKSLTDRSIVSVCIGQIRASDSNRFNQFVTNDLKTSQLMVTVKGDRAKFNRDLINSLLDKAKEIFPDNHPYVDNVHVSGRLTVFQKMNDRLMNSQIISVSIAIIVVFILCTLILRSVVRGFIAVLPLTMTVVINLGLMGFLGIAIKEGSLLVSAIGIGAGIDYTIHFIQRYKTEHLAHKKDFKDAYLITLNTTGKAVIFNAFSVAGGLIVLALSNFKMLGEIGLLLGIAMIITSSSALTLLPSLLKWVGPRFFGKKENQLQGK